MTPRHAVVAASLSLAAVAGTLPQHGCVHPTPAQLHGSEAAWVVTWAPRLSLEPVATITVPGVGAGQGVFIHNDFVYLFGDAETGVIREFTWSPEDPYWLTPTGRDIRCTRDGVDLAPHPTGLTHHPDFGTLLGDTVRQKGTIFHIDFDRALADGNLDHAVLATIVDDAATNGTRPEFVTFRGKTYVATADYGDADNHVRLYDPATLLAAERTTDPDVLAHAWPSGAFVQSLRWLPARNATQQSDRAAQSPDGTLVLVQNMTAGEGYRLTPTVLGTTNDLRDFPPYDMAETKRELEGFVPLPGPDAPAILFSAHAKCNVIFALIDLIE